MAKSRTWFNWVNFGFSLILGILVLYPFYNSVLISFTPQTEYVRTPFLLFPRTVTLDSYRVVFDTRSLYTGFGVTTCITVLGVVYNMLLTLMLAYGFNKNFPGKKLLLYLVILTMYFNGGLIPFYLLIKDLHLIDRVASMILPTGVTIAYMTVMRKYFQSLPVEIEESAKIDGANELTVLVRIILPLAMPMVVTFALYYGVERWNEWWLGMLFVQSTERQPLQLVLRGIIQATGNMSMMSSKLQEAGIVPYTDGVKMASIVVVMAPIMCVYPFLQRYFVQGLAIGAVKG